MYESLAYIAAYSSLPVVLVTFFNHNFVNCKAILILEIKKIANNISTMGDNSTAAECNSRLITVLVQYAHDIVSVT